MHKVGGKLILWMLIIALILFTAIRTLHFLQMTFPPELGYVAYLGLAAFDIGILGWLYYASHSAEGDSQRALAYGMIFVCMGGVIVTTIADMIIVSAQNGLTKLPPQWSTIGLWGVIIVIILNVIAGILVHLNAPSHKRHFAMESARDKIHTTVLSHIAAQADVIAPQIAEHTARHWANQVIHEMTGSIPGAYQAPQLAASRVVDADTSVASRDHVLDRTNVQEKIDSEVKPIEKKSLLGRIKDTVNFSTPEVPRQTGNASATVTDDRPITEERPGQPARKRRLGGDQDFTDQEDLEESDDIVEPDYGKIDTPELPENYHDWNGKQWQQARRELTPERYSELFDEVFPPEGLKPTPKKRNGGKQTKNVTRRQLLTGNQGD